MIQKILIANRGEIAMRLIVGIQEMGLEAVILYAENDQSLPYISLANESYPLGAGSLAETYLNQDKIVELALSSGSQAIHPGYGLLSENSEFCTKVEAAGLIFIGPTPQAMQLMGDKTAAKSKAQALGVPLLPGYHGTDQSEERLVKEAKVIGYPLLIKASAGGGGKGMRVVHKASELTESLAAVKRESCNAFGKDEVLLERYLEGPRHIEVQVLSDTHGQHFHLFERECSLQRRHQKVIEEAPSSFVDQSLRTKMTQASVELCQGIEYRGVGTIEFLVDSQKNFYFLEMNTRLQVEHPVTENITGLDLVKLQVQVAQGEKLCFSQADIVARGHSFEARLYAEDPDQKFLPTTGKLQRLKLPVSNNLRWDGGYAEGDALTIDYDPLIGKLISFGADRETARNNLIYGLKKMFLGGLKTNREFLIRLLEHPEFAAGNLSTDFIEQYQAALKKQDSLEECLQALGVFSLSRQAIDQVSSQRSSPWELLNHFRNC